MTDKEKKKAENEENKPEIKEETAKEITAAASPEEATAVEEKAVKKQKGKKRADPTGIAHIRASFNNTIISITDVSGNVICWSTPGKNRFKGSRKSTPYAAQISAEAVAKVALDKGVRKVEVKVRGAGAGREAAIRSIQAAGIQITSIKDITGVPHNGCRPPKRRRV